MTGNKVQSLGRIAVVLPNLRSGGAERMRVNMSHEWIERGFEVDFVLMRRDGELLDALPRDVRVFDLGVTSYRTAVGPIMKYLAQNRPSVLLAAMWPLTVTSIIAVQLSNTNARSVVSDHSVLSESYRGWGVLHRLILRASMAVTYRFADARIAVSRGVATDLSELSGIERKQFLVINNPAAIRVDDSDSKPCPAELAALEGPLILSVGTLKAVKNHKLMIDSFSRLPSELKATLCILGEGSTRPELLSLIERSGLVGRVLLPGFRSDTSPWYRRADVFVLSSNHEGFGNVIVEALNHGVPVVSTDCPSGPREILADGKYGRLVPVADADALAAGILSAIQDKPDREALKSRALDFSVTKIAREYLSVMFPSTQPSGCT